MEPDDLLESVPPGGGAGLLSLPCPTSSSRRMGRTHALVTGSKSTEGFTHCLINPCEPLTSVGLASWHMCPTGAQEPGIKVRKHAREESEPKCPSNCVPGIPPRNLPHQQKPPAPASTRAMEPPSQFNSTVQMDSGRPLNLPPGRQHHRARLPAGGLLSLQGITATCTWTS